MTEAELQVLKGLKHSAHGSALAKILRGRLAGYDQSLRRQEGQTLYQTQGRALEIEELLDLIEGTGASDQIQRLQSPRRLQV